MIKMKKLIREDNDVHLHPAYREEVSEEYGLGLNIDDSFSTLHRVWKKVGTVRMLEIMAKFTELENPRATEILNDAIAEIEVLKDTKKEIPKV